MSKRPHAIIEPTETETDSGPFSSSEDEEEDQGNCPLVVDDSDSEEESEEDSSLQKLALHLAKPIHALGDIALNVPGANAVIATNTPGADSAHEQTTFVGVYVAQDGTKWSRSQPEETRRSQRGHHFQGPESSVVETDSVGDPASAFLLLVTPSMVSSIVEHTNAEGVRSLGPAWRDTDDVEIRALLGCFLLTGAMKNNLQSSSLLWHRVYGIRMLQASFSHSRFNALCNHLRFDDLQTRSERRVYDPFAPIREIWDSFNTNLLRHYVPGPVLTVGEQVVPWRGRCPFLQSVPSGPERYGIKFFWTCDAGSAYPLRGRPCLVKPLGRRRAKLEHDMVAELTRPFLHTGRTVAVSGVSVDLPLMEHFLLNDLSLVGTVGDREKFLPKEFLDEKPKGEAVFGFHQQATLCSYSSASKTSTILLSTKHDDSYVVPGLSAVPLIVADYDSAKVGVHHMTQQAQSLTSRHKTKRWPLVVFFNILDLAALASRIIYSAKFMQNEKSSTGDRTLFQVALAEGLLADHVRRRSCQRTLSQELRAVSEECVAYLDGAEPGKELAIPHSQQSEQTEFPASGAKRGRCSVCSWKRDRKSAARCERCQKIICNEHTKKFCPGCFKMML